MLTFANPVYMMTNDDILQLVISAFLCYNKT
nr:MAG TPA: hypothetical protein [Caudoviricetes sp.]